MSWGYNNIVLYSPYRNMENTENYYKKLKFFFVRRWTDIDQQAIKQLDKMSDEEIRTLYDIVFAKSEEERLQKVNSFYAKLENKEKNALKYMADFKGTMWHILQELEEIGEKSENEGDLDVAIAKI